ncbi:MAG: sigma-70 family RNA polymerase sigma factor [Pirellulales bacterium]|nr:sigma-70 family RNA polymerase sigma factor [Pirellulales bacterium]
MVANSSASVQFDDGESGGDGFESLLVLARGGDRQALGELLQWYVNYLSILATTQLDRRLRRRINPSDLVQETMLAAHRDFGAFRGQSQPELLGWLRQILINTLHRNFARHIKAGKRDIRREVSIDQISSQLEESACNLASLLPAKSDSPSASLRAREDAVELANQLSKLRSQYREVIVYRVLQGLSFDEIAQRMGRSGGAVRMLWLRALEQFKQRCELSDEA